MVGLSVALWTNLNFKCMLVLNVNLMKDKGSKSGDNEDNGIHVPVTMKHTTHTTTAYIKYINEVLCQHIMSNIPA